MKKTLGVILSYILSLCAIAFYFVHWQTGQIGLYENFVAKQKIQLANYEDLKLHYEQYSCLTQALATVDQNYSRQDNNCFDHSIALQNKLRACGIESSIFINENRNHAWVGVWLESTNGNFIDPLKNNLHPVELRSDRNTVIMADPIKSKVPVSTSSFPMLWWK